MSLSSTIGSISVGICCCDDHTPECINWVGIVVTGAKTIISEGANEGRIGDIVVGCHTQIIASGSSSAIYENSPPGRIGDITVGCTSGVLVTGTNTVDIGD